jgi:hypothetical protein
MTDDVFTGDKTGDQTTSALEELVGDGKKFANNELLAEGKRQADNHIATLEAENAALKEKSGSEEGKATIADLIEAMKATKEPNTNEGDKPMSDEDFQDRVRDIISGVSEGATRTTNRALGNKLVLDKVGGDTEVAKAYVAERATALGITPDALGELSETSPSAFAKLMEVDASKASAGTGSLPGINTQTELQPNVVLEVDGHKTKAHYDALRKELGVKKWLNDTNIQTAMAKDANALGAKFNP